MRFAQTANTANIVKNSMTEAVGSGAAESRETLENLEKRESKNSTQKLSADSSGVQVLALGQKAAYFENTNHFVNVIEGGGMIGYEAVIRTARLMRDAYKNEQDMRELVQIKGMGCEGVCCK